MIIQSSSSIRRASLYDSICLYDSFHLINVYIFCYFSSKFQVMIAKNVKDVNEALLGVKDGNDHYVRGVWTLWDS